MNVAIHPSPSPMLREYLAVPTIRHYVLIEQDCIGLVHHTRHPEGWLTIPLQTGQVLALPGMDVEIPVDALYTGVNLPDEAASAIV